MCEHRGPASPPHPLRSRSTPPRPWTRLVAALSCTLALVGFMALAGCSAPADAPHGKIVLGFSAWPGWFPWQVAQEQGLFAKNNVNVELRYFESYTDSLNALATGKIDANSQTLNDTLASVSGGAEAIDRPRERQLHGQRQDHRSGRDRQRRRPQGQEGRRRAGNRRPLPCCC